MSLPIMKRELGHLSVAVWNNQRDEGDGTFQSVSISRRYFDRKEGEWKSSSVSLNPADVPVITLLLASLQQELIRAGDELA